MRSELLLGNRTARLRHDSPVAGRSLIDTDDAWRDHAGWAQWLGSGAPGIPSQPARADSIETCFAGP